MKLTGIVLLLTLIVFSTGAIAQTGQLKFEVFPKNMTEGSPFLWVVDTPAMTEPSRVSWLLLGNDAAGSFVKVGQSKWACFFSKAAAATCGLQPFISGGLLTARIYATSPQLSASQEFAFSTGDATVTGDKVIKGNGLLSWVVVRDYSFTGGASVKYAVYTDKMEKVAEGTADFAPAESRYAMNASLNPGKYYVVFDVATNDGKTGGTVVDVEIGGSAKVQRNLDADPLQIDELVSQGGSITKFFNIRNPLLNDITGLAYEISPRAKQIISVDLLGNGSVPVGQGASYQVAINNIQKSFSLIDKIRFTFTSGSATLSEDVPIDITVGVPSTASSNGSPILEVKPEFIFYLDGLVSGEQITKAIVLKNVGSGQLEVKGYHLEGLSPEEASVTGLEKQTLGAGEKIEATIKLMPRPGKTAASIILQTDIGERKIPVSFEAVEDPRADIDSLSSSAVDMKNNLSKNFGLKESDISVLFSDVDTDLSDADSHLSKSRPLSASLSYKKALGEFNAIKNAVGRKQSGGDILLPVLIIVIIAGLAVFLVKKLKKKMPEAEEEGEADELLEEES